MLTVRAPAKVNRSLYITRKRPDGYHDIVTNSVFTELADVLTLAPSELLTLSVQGEFAHDAGQGPNNLVLKAAHALNQHAGTRHGARMTLEKNIPVGAGLGGGSADAAAALKALNDLWQLGFSFAKLCEIGATLGADVPMCLHNVPLIARGLGEVIVPLEGPFQPAWLVLVHPRIPLLTKEVFARVDPAVYERAQFVSAESDALEYRTNHLQEAAIALCPEIAAILAALENAGEHAAEMRMTGSGACCFALFFYEDDAKACFARMQAVHPQWWVALTQTEMV